MSKNTRKTGMFETLGRLGKAAMALGRLFEAISSLPTALTDAKNAVRAIRGNQPQGKD